MEPRAQQFLNTYLETLTAAERDKYTSFSADYFCADEKNANICADLICDGIKTATCSMKYWYESEGETMPSVGHLQVVTNWSGEPVAIIETTAIRECRYADVTAEFAAAEGEGDRSLVWWRKAHWDFFAEECREIGIRPSEDMLLVLEWFKVVFIPKLPQDA